MTNCRARPRLDETTHNTLACPVGRFPHGPARPLPTACALSLVLLVCGGCPSLPEPQWKGEHVIFATDHPEQVCAGSTALLDQRAGELLALFDSDPGPIEFYLLDDPSEHCEEGSVGCSEPGVVFSRDVPHLHELVHARSKDRMPPALEEGLATHLGDPYPIRAMAPRERLHELLTTDLQGIEDGADYGRAGHFFSFLTEIYGLESVVALDAALGPRSSVADVDAAFVGVFGLGTQGMLEQYEDYPECRGSVDVSIACQQDPITLDALNVSFQRLVDCASPTTFGPSFGLHVVELVVELEPSLDGSRIVRAIGDGADEGGQVLLRRCGPCPEGGVELLTSELEFLTEEELPGGRYLVHLMLPIDASPAELGLEITG